MKLDAHELPGNLYWENEFDHKPVAQSQQRSVGGALVVESQVLMAGQKIRLTGDWADYSVVKQLKDMEAAVATVRTLTLPDATTVSVVFDIEAGGVEAASVFPESKPQPDTQYNISINLITVES